jgi:formylglycine-generating enzyme required for sulfatase activity
MVVIAPGSFNMGSAADPLAAPVVEVRIDYPFAISAWEITVAEYRLFCESTGRICPSSPWSGEDYPVTGVSWQDAVDYAAWLSLQTGHSYRLPSEAEWEYTARAGSTTVFPFGDELYPGKARYSAGRALVDGPVPKSDRSTERNNFKLWHMVGNVREWVADSWQDTHSGSPTDGSARPANGSTHVLRGGTFSDGAQNLRSAAREEGDASLSDDQTGFRLVREIEP